MKKEYILVAVIGMVILSLALDNLGGTLRPTVQNPFEYLNKETLTTYPLTSASIILKTLAIFLGTLFIFSLIEKKYTAKGLFLFLIAAVLELYSIQQFATQTFLAPMEWSMSFAWSGAVLLLPAAIFIILGFTQKVHQKISQSVDPSSQTEDLN